MVAVALDIDAVLFDLDDTLLDGDAAWRSGVAAMLRRCSGVDRSAAFAAWGSAFNAHFDDYLAGRLSLEESRTARVRSWATALSIDIDAGAEPEWFAAYLVGYQAGWKPFADVGTTLRKLAHLKLGVITNGDGQQQRAKIAALDLPVTFDAVVASSEAGCAKPDVRIFRAAAEQLGLATDRCLFVGDREDVDAMGARNAGMHAIWLNRRGLTGATDVASVATLADLAELMSAPSPA
jgi:putative hydrolase of the HAD superfamily